MYKILIIVPTKNSWKNLKRLVKSLDIQKDKNFRVLIIDSNSCKKHIKYLIKLKNNFSNIDFINQTENSGIYGAMNEGFKYANKNEWILFWGSDDFASSKNTIKDLRNLINSDDFHKKDMIIFKGFYFDTIKNKITSVNHFSKISNTNLNYKEYRNKLLMGFRQSHQSTLINPNNNLKNLRYEEKFSLAADLNYFMEASSVIGNQVVLFNKHLVNIGIGGISRRRHFRRTFEVLYIYLKEFKFVFFIPFILRYSKN